MAKYAQKLLQEKLKDRATNGIHNEQQGSSIYINGTGFVQSR